MKAVIAFIGGMILGAVGGAGYFYPQVQSALNKVSLSETSMQSLKDEAAKIKGTLDAAAKEAKDKLAQYEASKQTDDQTIKSLKDQLAAATAAKDAAEKSLDETKKALEDAKKPAPQ